MTPKERINKVDELSSVMCEAEKNYDVNKALKTLEEIYRVEANYINEVLGHRSSIENPFLISVLKMTVTAAEANMDEKEKASYTEAYEMLKKISTFVIIDMK